MIGGLLALTLLATPSSKKKRGSALRRRRKRKTRRDRAAQANLQVPTRPSLALKTPPSLTPPEMARSWVPTSRAGIGTQGSRWAAARSVTPEPETGPETEELVADVDKQRPPDTQDERDAAPDPEAEIQPVGEPVPLDKE